MQKDPGLQQIGERIKVQLLAGNAGRYGEQWRWDRIKDGVRDAEEYLAKKSVKNDKEYKRAMAAIEELEAKECALRAQIQVAKSKCAAMLADGKRLLEQVVQSTGFIPDTPDEMRARIRAQFKTCTHPGKWLCADNYLGEQGTAIAQEFLDEMQVVVTQNFHDTHGALTFVETLPAMRVRVQKAIEGMAVGEKRQVDNYRDTDGRLVLAEVAGSTHKITYKSEAYDQHIFTRMR